MARGLVRNTDRQFSFMPSIYAYISHHQFTPLNEWQKHVGLVEQDLRARGPAIIEALKAQVHHSHDLISAIDFFECCLPVIQGYFSRIPYHGSQWFEIMMLDGALQKIYPTTLPPRFVVGEEAHTPQSILAVTALPKKLFPMIEERYHLLQLAQEKKEGKDISSGLEHHASMYGWMNSLCWWDEPFGSRYYEREVTQLAGGDPQGELQTLKQKRQAQYERAEMLLAELKMKYPEAWQYLDFIRDLADLKEENWDPVSIAGARLRGAWQRLAAKHHLSYNQLLSHTLEELYALIESDVQTVPVDLLNERIQSTTIVTTMDEQSVVSGPESRVWLDLVYIIPRDDRREITGMTIWSGKVTGAARILHSVDDLAKMQPGAILVCPMTDPDYMPAIRQASAIVTDQGGLLCHAAIVARELQIPCVVGTEFATKILHDGDMVEVDAERGIVKKI